MTNVKPVPWAVVAAVLLAAGPLRGQSPATPSIASAPDSGQVDFPVVIRLSEQFLSLLISPEVNDVEPVDVVVLGTRATGTAWIDGTLHLDLKPNARGVGMNVCFDGTCFTRTVGRNGPAIIHSTSTTNFSAQKPLAVSVDRGITDNVASITASTAMPLPCIESALPRLRGRIVRRVAQRRAQQVRPQVIAIAQGNAESRIGRSFDGAVERLLAEYNEDLDILRPAIQRLREENPDSSLLLATTEDHLLLAVGRADSQQGPELPESKFDSSPIQVWLHRSVLGEGNSSAEEQLAQIRLIRTELEQQLAERFRSRPSVIDLVRSVPVFLGTAEDWVVIGLPPPLPEAS